MQKTFESLKDNDIEIIGNPIVLVYNSPYKIFNRKNEILIKISNPKKNKVN